MLKILCIDFGAKRCGLAISDELQMIGTPLRTVRTHELLADIEYLLKSEALEGIVIGKPKDLKGNETDASKLVTVFTKKLKGKFPDLNIWSEDERFTSKIALQSMLEGNVPKNKRRDKSVIDKVSAAIILQSFLDKRWSENKK
ncbi:MAG TPA: Holliday junction resolvase RuvX [Flavobacteriales bacterium]|nr:Holliday junction resolvase RuvX [Flavobacteriales bacterium]